MSNIEIPPCRKARGKSFYRLKIIRKLIYIPKLYFAYLISTV